MSVAQQLMDMGFPEAKAKAAAAASKENIERALDWIDQNDSDTSMDTDAPAADVPAAEPNPTPAPAAVEEEKEIPAAAACFKCDDCGKLLANEDAVMFHATKTKHENFSESTEEIKPLTPEEKAAKVLEIRQKIKAHQEKKAKIEAEEAREKERKRREDGKAMIAHKEAARDREIREAAMLRRREKSEDEIARQRVLEQIRADKEARKAKAAGLPVPEQKPIAPPPQIAPSKDYSTTTLQFRLLDGSTVRQKFEATEPLAMVRAWVEVNHTNGTMFTMMTPFPRKVFTEDDMGTPLKALGLVPSANVVLNRPT